MSYKELVDKITPKENIWKNVIVAFLSGGVIGSVSQVLVSYVGINYMLVIWIVTASILTGMGVMDDICDMFKMGVIIPITGFSHSVTSSSIEYKKDGLISGIGSNYFKLAGSVILYGVVSSSILSIVRSII